MDNKRLYVFGGGDGPHYFNELYMLDTGTATLGTPCFRYKRTLLEFFLVLMA